MSLQVFEPALFQVQVGKAQPSREEAGLLGQNCPPLGFRLGPPPFLAVDERQVVSGLGDDLSHP